MEWLDDALSEGVIPDDAVPLTDVAPASDIAEVNRLMRGLRSVQRRKAEVEETARAEYAAIAAWVEDRMGTYDGVEARILRALEGWMRGENEATGVKTHKLPHGELKVRPRRTTLGVDEANETDLCQWLIAHGHGELVRVKMNVDKAAALKAVAVGDVFAEVDAEGTQRRHAAVGVPDEETGEITDLVAIGMWVNERLPDGRGLTFSVKLNTDEQEA